MKEIRKYSIIYNNNEEYVKIINFLNSINEPLFNYKQYSYGVMIFEQNWYSNILMFNSSYNITFDKFKKITNKELRIKKIKRIIKK